MKAVFRHELTTCFTTMTAYVFAAFLLIFAGIYTMAYNLSNYCIANFEYVLSGMSFVFLIIVPILTMRIISEERRQKTDQLLYSLPIKMTDVVLGKYLALICVFLVPVIIIGITPLILTKFGTVNLKTSYSALIGFFFLGASLIAVGVFISSVTENQAVAAGLCFVVLLLNYFLDSLSGLITGSSFGSLMAFTAAVVLVGLIIYLMTKNGIAAAFVALAIEAVLLILFGIDSASFSGIIPDVMEKLSLFARFEVFVNGIFDLTAIVFYATVAGIFLFLSVQSMEKRRWSE